MINVCSDVLKTNIISQIKSVGFFAIMVDDARYMTLLVHILLNHVLYYYHFNRCHKVEYMSICVRYVKDLEVYERFLGFMDVSEKQDAQTLVNTIFQFLEHSNLGNIPIFAQSYDGASVMSGKRNGVQSKLLERYPCAIYTHCMAHRINLVVVDMCKNVEVILLKYIKYKLIIFSKILCFVFSMQKVFLTVWKHYTYISHDHLQIKN